MLLWWGWVALSWHHQLALRIWTQIGLVEKIKQSMSPSTDDFPVGKGTWKRLIWQSGVSTGSSPRVGKWRGCAWPRNLAGRCAVLTCAQKSLAHAGITPTDMVMSLKKPVFWEKPEDNKQLKKQFTHMQELYSPLKLFLSLLLFLSPWERWPQF